MTVHNAKGLEFDAVAVPDLSRSLLAGARPPLLALGRGQPPRVGMQLRRLGAGAVNLYDYAVLCGEAKGRDSEEGLRLFHVAATRARERLILSGVVKPEPGRGVKPGTPVVERIVDALGVERDADATVVVPAAEARPGLDAVFAAGEIAVRVNLPSPERAKELARTRRDAPGERPLGDGPPPLVERRPPVVPSRPLSYTAISAYEECSYRFYMERVLGLGPSERTLSRIPSTSAAQGAAVHTLLEWSQANGWSEPSAELALRHAVAAGLDPETTGAEALLDPVRGWLRSPLLRERIGADGSARARAEVPILLGVGGTVLRGSIDLLVERDGVPPLVVDYKTDRLDGSEPEEHAARYATQRAIYALAVAESLEVDEVEVAYVFLERPGEPVLSCLDSAAMEAGEERLAATIARIARGEFPVAPAPERSWSLCRGCPALGRLCSGPHARPNQP
jgi:ATP-dependent helicase/nuclease subunit A